MRQEGQTDEPKFVADAEYGVANGKRGVGCSLGASPGRRRTAPSAGTSRIAKVTRRSSEYGPGASAWHSRSDPVDFADAGLLLVGLSRAGKGDSLRIEVAHGERRHARR